MTNEAGDDGDTPASRWSRAPEDLTREPLLRHASKLTVDGAARPSMGGRIALLSRLGRGGMGVVYHGAHARLGTEVAVKCLPLALHGQAEEMVRRFEREAQIAARLSSPHLVHVSDIDEDESTGCHFIVMEYVHGLSADRVMKDHGGPLPEADALDIAIGATRGLVVAHLEGVVHRDIKPSNILVPADADGRLAPSSAKLADLGLARHDQAETDVTLTSSLMPMGTPGYMAPEQSLGARRAKKPADVFAMGATVYALLAGKAPFSGENLHECLENTRSGRRRPLREARPDVSLPTAALVDRCLEIDPTLRYADAAALLEALLLCRTALGGAAGSEVTTRVVELTQQPERGKRVVSSTPHDTERPTAIDPAAVPPTPSPIPTAVPLSAVSAPVAPTGPAAPTAPVAPSEPSHVSSAAPPPSSRGRVVAAVVLTVAAAAVIVLKPWESEPTKSPEVPPAELRDEPAPPPRPASEPVSDPEPARAPEPTKSDAPPPPPPAPSKSFVELRGLADGVLATVDGRPAMGRVEVKPGRVTVRFTFPGHRPQTREIEVAAGDAPEVWATAWEPLAGSADLSGLAPGVTAEFEGRRLVHGDALPAGEQSIRLERAGWRAQTVQLTVTDGAAAAVTAGAWERAGLGFAWKAGQRGAYTETSQATFTLVLGGERRTGSVTTERTVTVEVASVGDDGTAALVVRFPRFREDSTNIDGESSRFDTDQGTGSPVRLALVRRSLRVNVTSDGSVLLVNTGGFQWTLNDGSQLSVGDTERNLTADVRDLLPRFAPADANGSWTVTHEEFRPRMTNTVVTVWTAGAAADGRTPVEFSRRVTRSEGAIDGFDGFRLTAQEETGTVTVATASGLPLAFASRGRSALEHPNAELEFEGTLNGRWTWTGAEVPAAPPDAAPPEPPPAPSKSAPPEPEKPAAGPRRLALADGTVSAEIPAGWNVLDTASGRVASPGNDAATAGLVSVSRHAYPADYMAMIQTARIDAMLNELRTAVAGDATTTVGTLQRISDAGRLGAAVALEGRGNGALLAGWVAVIDDRDHAIVVIAVAPKAASAAVIAEAKRMLPTVRVEAARPAPAGGGDLAGLEFGASSFFSSGSITTVYTFRAGGAATRRTMSSFSTGGGSDSEDAGSWTRSGDAVTLRFDAESLAARIERGGGRIVALVIGNRRYPVR